MHRFNNTFNLSTYQLYINTYIYIDRNLRFLHPKFSRNANDMEIRTIRRVFSFLDDLSTRVSHRVHQSSPFFENPHAGSKQTVIDELAHG